METIAEYSGRGRPPSKETLDDMKRILEAVRENPRTACALIARKLGMNSLRCSSLSRRLAREGLIEVVVEGRQIFLNTVQE